MLKRKSVLHVFCKKQLPVSAFLEGSVSVEQLVFISS